jgi:hypothetical protein
VLDAGLRLQRPLLPRLTGVLPAHRRLGLPRKALKADYDESVWDHLAGARSAPFEAGEQKQVAVKVIDDRGNELLVVKALP